MESPTQQRAGALMTVMEEAKSSNAETESTRKRSVQMSKDTLKRKDSNPKACDPYTQKPVKWTSLRRVSMMSNFSTSSRRFEPTPEPQRTVPPTYRLQPKEGEEFHWWKAKPLIQDLISVYSSDLIYNPKACSRQCLILADMVKNKMKMLGCIRHKIIVTVDIGENKGQAVTLASRCCWDTKSDNSLHVEHNTKSVFIVVGVYAIYKD